MSRNLSSPVKASLHFSLSRSGIFSLDRADAVIEISEWVEVPKKNVSAPLNLTVEADSTKETDASDDTSTHSVNTTANDQNTLDLGTEKKLKKRTFRIPLKVWA